MRGADAASGYAVELVRRGPRPCPDCARAFAGYVAEGTSERSQTFPARVEGNLGDGPIGVAEQRRSPLDAPREQVAMRRYAEGLFERSREMGLGDSAHSCQPLHRPVLVRGGVHSVLRAQQPPQQFGILAHAPSFTDDLALARARARGCAPYHRHTHSPLRREPSPWL